MRMLIPVFGRALSRLSILVCLALTASLALSQPNTPTTPKSQREVGTLFLTTNVGSFKFKSMNDANPAFGKVTMSFTGTLLVVGLKGTVKTDPTIREEYRNDAHNRRVFFGKGKVEIDGDFRSMQWFGRGLTCTWRGSGLAFLVGEFDKNLETGWYWFADDPEKQFWSTGGKNIMVPVPVEQRRPIPVPRPRGGV
jgi:hypothetical protein